MFPKLLIPLDGSRPPEATLIYAAQLAKTVPIEEIVVLWAVEGGGTKGFSRADKYLEHFASQLTIATTTTSKVGVPRAPCIQRMIAGRRPGQVAETIVQFSEDNRENLIMLTSHGRSGVHRPAAPI